MRASKKRVEVAPEILEGFARELAEYRLNPRSGVADDIRTRIRKSASRHGQSFADLWGRVHQAAYVIVDAHPRFATNAPVGQ